MQEEMEKKVLEECCMRRRAGKTRIHERAAEVCGGHKLQLLRVP
jgi:hypothetical protein